MFARAIAKHLSGRTLGGVDLLFVANDAGGNVFVAHMPDQPDTAVAVMPDGGRAQLTKVAYDLPSVQLIVRSADPATAHDVAVAVMEALNCLDGVTLDDGGADEVSLVGLTAAQSHPIPMGLDPARRHEFSVPFDGTVSAPTTNRSA